MLHVNVTERHIEFRAAVHLRGWIEQKLEFYDCDRTLVMSNDARIEQINGTFNSSEMPTIEVLGFNVYHHLNSYGSD